MTYTKIGYRSISPCSQGLASCHVTTQYMSTQPCIPPGSLNRVPASAGGKGGNVTSAGWQVTLRDPMWHVTSRSGVATLRTAIGPTIVTYCYLLTALKRCTSTETLWNRKAPSLSSPEDEIFLPKLPKSWHADVFKGSKVSTAIGAKRY